MRETITSFRNPLVKRIKRLRQPRARREEGLYFVEGLRVVLTALERGAPVERLLVAESLLSSPVARERLAEWVASGGNVTYLAPEILASLSSRDHSAGLAALVQPDPRPLPVERPLAGAIFVALWDMADPGNLGTILRTADAVRAAGVVVVGQSTDPFQGAVARASMGALFAVPVHVVPAGAAVLAWAAQIGLTTVALSARAEATLWETAVSGPALLLLGSERAGLPDEVLAGASLVAGLPMAGVSSSLNVAVAAGVVLYELARRRGEGETAV